MACYSPVTAYRAKVPNASGKRSIVFNTTDGYSDRKLEIPCGKCIGCRLTYAKNWAIRCMHEASLYEENCFITLTYNEENYPENGSLDKTHYQKFIKRLRRYYEPERFRYILCGEYGEQLYRPHYHAILFNLDFPDKTIFKQEQGNILYTSDILSKIWGKGHCLIGSATFQSASYVAQYCLKKKDGEKYKTHYMRNIDLSTGTLDYELQPEFVSMSRNPGIGHDWFKKFHEDCYPSDFITFKGQKYPVPKYYEKLAEKSEELLEEYDFKNLKKRRKTLTLKHKEDLTYDRLKQRETVKKAQIKQNKRKLEELA